MKERVYSHRLLSSSAEGISSGIYEGVGGGRRIVEKAGEVALGRTGGSGGRGMLGFVE